MADTIPGSVEERRRAADLALLRRFEPVLYFNSGEQYTPQGVDSYVKLCSLWLRHAEGTDEMLVERGDLTVEQLTQPRTLPPGSVLYLDYVDPLDLPELTALRLREGVDRLRRGPESFRPKIGRLARLGAGSRLLAAVFSLTLLLRGRVPGDAAAAAWLASHQDRLENPEQVYYGRIVRDRSGWTILQYWYFYCFDNWRSGFYGANDHEADWEMAAVYLYQDAAGEYIPRWVAFSCHDFTGPDLRRRWDDPTELTLIGEHPVMYVGVGSHAGYFRPGDYLAEVDVPLFAPLARSIEVLRQFWVGTLHQAGVTVRLSRLRLLRVPFVDYARGDGVVVGPEQATPWTPILLDPLPDWISRYRGLWGFYARDPLAGENSPAGPMFDRDGTPRRSWNDPLGWVGLDGAPTPVTERETLERRRGELLARQSEIDAEIETEVAQLERVGLDLAVLAAQPYLPGAQRELTERRSDLRRHLTALRDEHAECNVLLDAIQERESRLDRGISDPPRAHILNLAVPVPEPGYRMRRVAEVWSALSIAVLTLAVLGLFLVDHERLAPHLLVVVIGFLLVDALLHRQVRSLVSGLAVVLAVVCVGVLIFELAWEILLGVVLAAVLYLAWSNVREVLR